MATNKENTDELETAVDGSYEVVDDDDWAMVEGGVLKGMKYEKDKEKGAVFLSLSSEFCRDVDRWREMPSLEEYPSLKKLELYKNRYIQKLHDSVCILTDLEVLSLVRCEKIHSLPMQIGNLKNLQVLDLADTSELSSLPESFGGLTSLRRLTIGGHQGSGNKVLKVLPSTFSNLTSLEILNLDKCKELESLPLDIGKLINLKVLLMR